MKISVGIQERQVAWAHGISTNPIVYHGMRFLPEDFRPSEEGDEIQT